MKRVLLIVGGGIAAYKALDVIRLLRAEGLSVRPVMTSSAKEFVTPLSLEALAGERVHDTLFAPTQESEIGHIRLARDADVVLVCPASANLMARMAHGLADDLATTLLLATTAPVIVAPAMNVRMWEHAATQANMAQLAERGVQFIGPDHGSMACGEVGMGRLSTPEVICQSVLASIKRDNALQGKRILVTAGPTREPLDPVRFLSNHSSGKQGYAIAEALAARGADVVLVSGPVSLPAPPGVTRVSVETADEMLSACTQSFPVDVAVCTAAVSDWRAKSAADQKIKKTGAPPVLELSENPDILAEICRYKPRPSLVVGFAAETETVLQHATQKRLRKGCDWLVANDVSTGVFGADHNRVTLITEDGAAEWPHMSKHAVGDRLAEEIIQFFNLP